MKHRLLIPCIVALAGLALFLARRPTGQPHRPPVATPSSPASPTPVASAALPQPPTIAATDTTELRSDASSFPKFDAWTSRYLSAPADQRAALLDEGVALAKARRAALAALIPAEPRQALDRAVPMAVRQELPHEIVALLEERLNARGFFGVKAAISDDGNVMPIRREVRLGDGRRYDAFTYGRRATQQTTENAYFNGEPFCRF